VSSFNQDEEWPRYPASLIRTLATGEPDSEAPAKKAAPKSPEQAGGRNNYFTSRAGQLRRLGYGEEEILAALRVENKNKGYEFPDRELATVVKSVARYEIGDETGAIDTLFRNVGACLDGMGLRVDAVGRWRPMTANGGGLLHPDKVKFLPNDVWFQLTRLGKNLSRETVAVLVEKARIACMEESFRHLVGGVTGQAASEAGRRELARFLRALIGTDSQQETVWMVTLRHFLWCVKRSLTGGQREYDVMPVLVGRQGTGKSVALKKLAGPLAELTDDITAETLADERKRGDLGNFAIGIWDEMEGADRRDVEAIKRAITSQTLSYRPLHTNSNTQVYRRMNFLGSSNKPLASVIRDPTGNRRFVEIAVCDKPDWDAINGIDYGLLWQAVSEADSAPIKDGLEGIRILQAEHAYRDSVQLWIEADPMVPGEFVATEDLYARYRDWCNRCGEFVYSMTQMGSRLKSEGFKPGRGGRPNKVRGFTAPIADPGTSTSGVGPSDNLSGGPSAGPLNSIEDKELMKWDHRDQHIEGYLTPETPTETEKPKSGGPGGPGGPTPWVQPWPTPPGGGELWVYDCEVFPNRFMFSAFNGREWVEFNETNLNELAEWIKDKRKVLAGFNNHGYDDVIIGSLAYDGRNRNAAAIYRLSTRIIEPKDQAEKDANFRDRYKGRPWAYSVDVFQLLNAKGSLKEWECRIGFPTVAESPADFKQPLPVAMVESVRQYCRNDVLATAQILLTRWPLVQLRETLATAFGLGTRAYALSEQGLAQATFLALHKEHVKQENRRKQSEAEAQGKGAEFVPIKTSSDIVRTKAAAAPENANDRLPLADLISPKVRFATPPFQAFLDRIRAGRLVKGEEKAWAIELDGQPLAETFHLGGCELSLGVGGLHTVDGPGIIAATDDAAIVDLDVTSYYPSLMISEGIYPSQLGEHFIQNMTELRERRVKAKREGDKTTADALKIVLNATFGKLNDNWSPIRSVSNAFRVTINGQLFLMMLIEALAETGFTILSANTDGVTIRAPRHGGVSLAAVMSAWERGTGMQLERTEFAKVCRRDVNNYVALATDGKLKTKGVFNADSGKGDGAVIRKAAIAYLLHGTDPAQTVANETDPTAFLFYQRAKNGGDLWYGETLIGKTARWYASTVAVPIRRKNPNGTFDTIPNGHKATLALTIGGLTVSEMTTLDRAHYIDAAWTMIRETGAKESR